MVFLNKKSENVPYAHFDEKEEYNRRRQRKNSLVPGTSTEIGKENGLSRSSSSASQSSVRFVTPLRS